MNTPAAVSAQVSTTVPARFSSALPTLVLLSFAHFFVDLHGGALGIFQPLLVGKLHLSFTQAGLLGGLLVFSSSVTQPIYGYLSDRIRTRMFTVLAPGAAALLLTGLSLAPSFAWALVIAFLGGAAVSAFHPQGASWAAAGFKTRKGQWMAVFISAGTLGMALSPSFYSISIDKLGFDRLLWTTLPALAFSLLLLFTLRPPDGRRASQSFDSTALKSAAKPLTYLFLAVFCRSAVQVCFAQFLALYLNTQLNLPLSVAATVLTFYLTAGAIGGFLGGRLADRFGARRVIMASFLFSVPFMAAFFHTSGLLSYAMLALGGFVLLFTIPVNVVVAQELVPSQSGAVSALMMGFAWGMAGMVFIPLTGYISDRTSLGFALELLLVFPLIGLWVTSRIPKEVIR
ncbi:MAG TPA: MFS transporter [Bryobacteraceae bacterium]|nr:MFS transporter [Bryobacteraceae bacterium]